jgi:hypothetical protein
MESDAYESQRGVVVPLLVPLTVPADAVRGATSATAATVKNVRLRRWM